jgi:hypothetical protein
MKATYLESRVRLATLIDVEKAKASANPVAVPVPAPTPPANSKRQ